MHRSNQAGLEPDAQLLANSIRNDGHPLPIILSGIRTGHSDRRSLAILSAGHLVNDLNPGAVPALLPFLLLQRQLSFTAVAGLVLAVTISSSIAQPVFGYLADRYRLSWLIPAGVLCAGLGLALTGIAPGYWLIFGAALFAGIGVGAYHPEAARFASFVSGARRATGMSLFSVGGGIGFALGPAVVTPLVLAFGLGGTLLMAVPSIVMTVVLALELPRLGTFRPAGAPADREIFAARQDRAAFARLAAVAVLRSTVYYGLITFAPLYFVRDFHVSPAQANSVLTAMLIAGAMGTVAIGPIADRYGRRTTLLGALSLVTIFTAVFVGSGRILATIALIAVGAAIVGTFSLALLMGQEYLPGNLGLASGLVLGLPDGVGGLAAPGLGSIADHVGLHPTLVLVATVAVLTVVLAGTLPEARRAIPVRTGSNPLTGPPSPI